MCGSVTWAENLASLFGSCQCVGVRCELPCVGQLHGQRIWPHYLVVVSV